jgi:flagellar protein FlgJ
MSIFPATDIVSDVANSADSRQLALGLQRLRNLSVSADGAQITNQSNPGALPESRQGAVNPAHFDAFVKSSAKVADRSAVAHGGAKSPGAIAAQKFEAFVLQTWLEVLLPRTEGGSFGTDGSANIWRSMMAEQLGMQLARNGAIGLKKIITAQEVGQAGGASGAFLPASKEGHLHTDEIREADPERTL